MGARLGAACLLCVLPLVTILSFYVGDRRDARAVTVDEAEGVQVLRLVRHLRAELLESRHDVRSVLAGDVAAQGHLEQRAALIDDHFDQLTIALADGGHRSAGDAAVRLQERWRALRVQPVEPITTDTNYASLLRQLHAVAVDTAQAASILLDSEAETYWLAVQLAQGLPVLDGLRNDYIELAFQSVTTGVLSESQRAEMVALDVQINRVLDELSLGYRTSAAASDDGQFPPDLAERLDSLLTTHQSLLDLTVYRLLQVDHPYLDPDTLEAANRRAIDAGLALWDASADRFEDLLAERIRRLDRATGIAITATVAMLLATAGFVATVLRSIRRPLRDAAAAARRIRAGQLDAAIPDHRGDEVGDLLESMSELLAHLRTLAYTDSLTGLPNRSMFADRLEDALDTLGGGSGVAVMFCDLDRFKEINDTMGHAAGDELLVAVAESLRQSMRPGDVLARFGGDEFTVVLSDLCAVEEAVAVAERIQERVRLPYRVRGQQLHLSASIGIAFTDCQGTTAGDLLRDADVALYRSKAGGRGFHTVFVEDMSAGAMNQLRFESDLRQAMENEELRLHYQPEVQLLTGEPQFFEALLRWDRSGGELIPPAAFIPVAEANGLILPFGRWVMEEACRQAMQWRCEHGADFGVAVNLSPRQLGDPYLIDHVRHALNISGLPAQRLRLELTESAMIDEQEATLSAIGALRELGVSLALDDFGTGYSSLSYLQRLPIDVLKIDRSFISGIDADPVKAAIVKSIIEMAEALSLDVVAEGVETEGERTTLIGQGCLQAQGFLFARPMAMSALEPYLIQGLPEASR